MGHHDHTAGAISTGLFDPIPAGGMAGMEALIAPQKFWFSLLCSSNKSLHQDFIFFVDTLPRYAQSG
jgi:hypothetical protein